MAGSDLVIHTRTYPLFREVIAIMDHIWFHKTRAWPEPGQNQTHYSGTAEQEKWCKLQTWVFFSVWFLSYPVANNKPYSGHFGWCINNTESKTSLWMTLRVHDTHNARPQSFQCTSIIENEGKHALWVVLLKPKNKPQCPGCFSNAEQ